jgi:hypothetical protein
MSFIKKIKYLIIIILLFARIHVFSQVDSIQKLSVGHIIFIHPAGLLVKDYSCGYEQQINNKIGLTLSVDYYMPWTNDYKISTTPKELSIYSGTSFRVGIKFYKKSGFFISPELIYKYSYYNNKLILRENFEGEAADKYYLESRICNSFGGIFKFGYQKTEHHLYFSPFMEGGMRLRFDQVTIHGKYDWRGSVLNSQQEKVRKIWPIPVIRIGFVLGIII